jgi:hypothetical protein
MRYFVFLLRFPGLGDLVILAVHAAEVTVSKKDISGAMRAREARLFAKMSSVRRDDR